MEIRSRSEVLRKAERSLTIHVKELTDRCRENFGMAESHIWRRAEIAARRLEIAKRVMAKH